MISFKLSGTTNPRTRIIAAGTFRILHLSPTNNSLSPFNVSSSIRNPYFSIEETTALFRAFARDNDCVINDNVIVDVWAKSNGYVVPVRLDDDNPENGSIT
jgi:hypothetical protein